MPPIDDVLRNLDVRDEVYPDCVRIEGINYSKDLFREWGKGGMSVGQLFRIKSREPEGVILIERISEPEPKANLS